MVEVVEAEAVDIGHVVALPGIAVELEGHVGMAVGLLERRDEVVAGMEDAGIAVAVVVRSWMIEVVAAAEVVDTAGLIFDDLLV